MGQWLEEHGDPLRVHGRPSPDRDGASRSSSAAVCCGSVSSVPLVAVHGGALCRSSFAVSEPGRAASGSVSAFGVRMPLHGAAAT